MSGNFTGTLNYFQSDQISKTVVQIDGQQRTKCSKAVSNSATGAMTTAAAKDATSYKGLI